MVMAFVLLSGCGLSARDQGVVDALMYRVSFTLTDLDESFRSSQATTFREFVDENSLPPDARPGGNRGLPWFNAVGLTESEIESHFGQEGSAILPRDVTVMSIRDSTTPAAGTVQVFILAGSTTQVGFGTDPHHYFYACVDIEINIESRTAAASRGECPDLPASFTRLADPLPESQVRTGDRWPP